ncbi:MAG: tetratricopeptide repeat protein [Verrucomicrobiota bacterium]
MDTADVFGAAFKLKLIPVTFLVDEVGIIRLRGSGPSRELLQNIEALLKEPVSSVRSAPPKLAAARTKKELEQTVKKNPADWPARLALASVYHSEKKHTQALRQLEAAAKAAPDNSEILFTWGMILFHQNQKEDALSKLKQARDLDPENWRIRKQIWAIEHPDKFYTSSSPDFAWQKEELAREKKAAPPRTGR